MRCTYLDAALYRLFVRLDGLFELLAWISTRRTRFEHSAEVEMDFSIVGALRRSGPASV